MLNIVTLEEKAFVKMDTFEERSLGTWGDRVVERKWEFLESRPWGSRSHLKSCLYFYLWEKSVVAESYANGILLVLSLVFLYFW